MIYILHLLFFTLILSPKNLSNAAAMKRRRFLLTGSLGAAGLGMSACNREGKPAPQKEYSASPSIPPKYKSMKPVHGKSLLGSNDKVVLALIGAGGWGTNLVVRLAQMKETLNLSMSVTLTTHGEEGPLPNSENSRGSNLKEFGTCEKYLTTRM